MDGEDPFRCSTKLSVAKVSRLLILMKSEQQRQRQDRTGCHTRNKIEGHWRQAKAKLPPFGVRKHHFSSYLAEFMWRYMKRDQDLFATFLRDVKKIYNPTEV